MLNPLNSTMHRTSAAAHFRSEIEKAEAAGVSRDDMTLLLTRTDVDWLKRDRSLAVSDIVNSGTTSLLTGTIKF